VTRRAALAASFALLGHLHWMWITVVLILESASMAARRLSAGRSKMLTMPWILPDNPTAVRSPERSNSPFGTASNQFVVA